ncbi:MAG: hypothetical protein FJZ63_04510 [Chlamydiae bacterium]|nr:hypothetical protein [Chlamydiota bacterium]
MVFRIAAFLGRVLQFGKKVACRAAPLPTPPSEVRLRKKGRGDGMTEEGLQITLVRELTKDND